MFNLSGNNMAVAPALGKENTLQSVIVGFTAAAGEYNLVGTAVQ